MVKRLLRTLLAVSCLVGGAASLRVFAQVPSPGAELLQRLPAAPDSKRNITMAYEFTRTTSKYKGTEEQLAAKLAAEKARLQADPRVRGVYLDDPMAVFEDRLRHGEITTLIGQAEIAPDYRAVAEKNAEGENERWYWTIQRGNRLSEYREGEQNAHVSDVPRQRETPLSLFLETVGLLGKPSAYMDAKIREARSVGTTGGKITVEIDDDNAVFAETPGHQFVLESFRTNGKGDPTTVRFEDYRTFGGVLVPTRITRDVSTTEFDIRAAYHLEDVEIGGELTIPFRAARIEAD